MNLLPPPPPGAKCLGELGRLFAGHLESDPTKKKIRCPLAPVGEICLTGRSHHVNNSKHHRDCQRARNSIIKREGSSSLLPFRRSPNSLRGVRRSFNFLWKNYIEDASMRNRLLAVTVDEHLIYGNAKEFALAKMTKRTEFEVDQLSTYDQETRYTASRVAHCIVSACSAVQKVSPETGIFYIGTIGRSELEDTIIQGGVFSVFRQRDFLRTTQVSESATATLAATFLHEAVESTFRRRSRFTWIGSREPRTFFSVHGSKGIHPTSVRLHFSNGAVVNLPSII
jgi:hypothetical protein